MFVAVWAAAIWCLFLIEGDLGKLWHAVEEVEPRLLTLPGPEGKATWQWWLTWPVFGIALYWAILPRGFLFFYSARDVKTVRRIGLTVGFYLMGLYLPAIVIGFTARYYLPDLLGSEADVSFPRLLAEYAPAWFTGVIVAGGLAAGMSSLDADTNANSAMLTQDVYRSFLRRQAPERHYIFVGRLFVVGLVALTVVLAMRDWGLVTLMIGVTASMITQLLPAVIAVTVPLRLRITKAGVTCGIVAGFTVSLLIYLLTWFYPALGFGMGFDPSFWGLVVNVPVLLLVSRFTSLPDPRAVARIRGVLEEEFGRRSRQAT
jgi:Na+/proline symporter